MQNYISQSQLRDIINNNKYIILKDNNDYIYGINCLAARIIYKNIKINKRGFTRFLSYRIVELNEYLGCKIPFNKIVK